MSLPLLPDHLQQVKSKAEALAVHSDRNVRSNYYVEFLLFLCSNLRLDRPGSVRLRCQHGRHDAKEIVSSKHTSNK